MPNSYLRGKEGDALEFTVLTFPVPVARVDDRDILWDCIGQILRKLGYGWEPDRDGNEVGFFDSSARLSGGRANFSGERLIPSRPREFAIRTSCPAALDFRARVPPIWRVPMMPIVIASRLSVAALSLWLLTK